MTTWRISEKNTPFSDVLEKLPTLSHENDTAIYTRAALLGFVGGLRSLTPFAMLSRTSELDPAPTNTVEEILSSPVTRVVTDVLASGELVGDKLPQVPSRISTGPLLARVGLGALAGMRICHRYQRSLVLGAILGAIAAVAGSYAGYYARSALARITHLPDAALGLLEDGAAFGLGYIAVNDPEM